MKAKGLLYRLKSNLFKNFIPITEKSFTTYSWSKVDNIVKFCKWPFSKLFAHFYIELLG